MEHLQTLLLPLLLLMCPPASTDYAWKWRERGGEAKAASRNHSAPYVAYLQGRDNHSCAGLLVAPGWVMTAAQCLVHEPQTVILGARTLQSREKSWQTFEVKEYHSHPGFKISNLKNGNDILLLKLNGNATRSDYVKPISLERSSKIQGSTECRVLSWGHRRDRVTLCEATVTIFKSRDCLPYYPGLPNKMICGKSKSSEVPAKDGAGDPLVCKDKAYGIFSYQYRSFGIYTQVAHFASWVDTVLKSA
ncbi:PREDICTED: granzyme K-like isoform X2 [Ficedula albicollis]|uniref:Peptidase S1 domain-containing protein n=1 Tax=Ficedula albicollis TaxID=59894 RepID=U3KHJ0_FICAL|nr:PREDICTED: granzyme K-like isoform X2 [Ficedula albicollis]